MQKKHESIMGLRGERFGSLVIPIRLSDNSTSPNSDVINAACFFAARHLQATSSSFHLNRTTREFVDRLGKYNFIFPVFEFFTIF